MSMNGQSFGAGIGAIAGIFVSEEDALKIEQTIDGLEKLGDASNTQNTPQATSGGASIPQAQISTMTLFGLGLVGLIVAVIVLR